VKCWICGNEAKTGEHLIKASDIRSYFGSLTKDKPVYCHTGVKKRKILQSADSIHVKSGALICNECNSSRTQEHDRAWETLSAYLQNNPDIMLGGKRFKLSKIFPGGTCRALLCIHLFFVKLFGCRIVEDNVPIDIEMFSNAIMNNKAHEHVYIGIGYLEAHETKKSAGLTDIEARNINEKSEFATWFYNIGNIGVNIIYWPHKKTPKITGHTWHPDSTGKIFRFSEFKT
jgi:hypothetical protein